MKRLNHFCAMGGVLLCGWLVGCPEETTEDVAPLDLGEGCQPLLAGLDCMLPYPSDFFRVEDASMPSGYRIEMADIAKIYTDDNFSADVTEYRASDGFSTVPPIVMSFGVPLAKDSFVGILDDHAASMQPASKTLVVNASTGELIPHFVDLDEREPDPKRQAMVIRPIMPLEEKSRYIVLVQKLQGVDGKNVETPEGFRRLRDGVADSSLATLQKRYDEEIFPVIENLGLRKEDLLLAWDFSTGSDIHVLNDMFRVRQLVMESLENTPPIVEITGSYESDDDEKIWRTIYGTIIGPMVSESKTAGSELHRDENGEVQLNGSVEFPFIAVVPASLRDAYENGDVLLFGHGFLYSRYELEDGATLDLLNDLKMVGFAVDWWGMSEEDVGYIITALAGDIKRAAQFGERLPQAMGNWITLTKAIEGPLQEEGLFIRPLEENAVGVVANPEQPTQSNAGHLLFDDTQMNFLGISQGHILGGVLAALHPRLDRIILHVGAAGLTHIMLRAEPFAPFLFMLGYTVSDLFEQQKLIATFQMHFDRFDPARYAPFVLNRDLLFGPEAENENRQVLMQMVVADTSVPNFGSYLHARGLGLPLMEMSTPNVFLFEEEPAPFEGSALTVFDFGLSDAFYEYPGPPEVENSAHNDLRKRAEVIDQMREFIQNGQIVDTCSGNCLLQ